MTAIVFMGTPDFAVPTLRALLQAYRVAGVVTQPDRAAGRGRRMQPAPVAQLARAAGLPLMQSASLRRDPAAVEQLRAWAPDVIVVAAFGQILKPEVLAIPPFSCLNVHASLLPRWRGAAPIAHAILSGDPLTGVSIMKIEEGLDSGPVLLAESVPIGPEDTTATLSPRLAALGARLMLTALGGWLGGTLQALPQDESGVTLAPGLHKEQGRLDWTQPAAYLARQVRAFDPWPGTYTTWAGRLLKVLRAAVAESAPKPSETPGTVRALDARIGDGLAVATGEGWLRLESVQLEGRRPAGAAEFARGYPAIVGTVLD